MNAKRLFVAVAAFCLLAGVTSIVAPPGAVASPGAPIETGGYRASDGSSKLRFTVTYYIDGRYESRGQEGALYRTRLHGDTKIVEREAWSGTPADAQYSFNRVTWQASLRTAVPSTVTRETYEQVAGTWVLMETKKISSSVTLDIDWVGDPATITYSGGPRPGYCPGPGSAPCVLHCETWASTAAIASGTVTSAGLGYTQAVNSEPGRLNYTEYEAWDPYNRCGYQRPPYGDEGT